MSELLKSLGIDRLTIEQRLNLIDEIWDSLPDDLPLGEIPESHKKLIDERLAEAEANPGCGVSYEEVLDRIERKR